MAVTAEPKAAALGEDFVAAAERALESGKLDGVPDAELGDVRMQCVVPRFSETPGAVLSAGPSIGQHNDEVVRGLGLAGDDIVRLRAAKII